MPGAPSCCVWLTGRRQSGKTTVARAVASQLRRRGAPVAVLDEAEVRAQLGAVDPLDALVWLARLVTSAGAVAILAVDVPQRATRDELRATLPGFVEVFVDGGPGADRDYEEPYAPELRVPTADRSPEASAAQVVSWLEGEGWLVGEPEAQARSEGRAPPS